MPGIQVMDMLVGEGRRGELWACIGRMKLQAWSIHNGQGLWYIVTEEEEYEKYLQKPVIDHFDTYGFKLLPPAELNSNKSVVVRQLDEDFTKEKNKVIANSIEKENSWAKVDNVTFLPCKSKQGMIKITFESRSQAQQAMHEGLQIFAQTIPPKYVEKEIFTRIVSCANCYSYQHYSNDCDKPKNNKCSKCDERGHQSTQCNKVGDFCLSCRMDGHRTFDRECPIRKKSLKEKSKTERKKERNKAMSRHRIYQERKRKYTGNSTAWNENWSLPGKAMAVIMTAIVSSVAIEKKSPGSFQDTLNSIMEFNQIPRVALPTEVIEKLKEDARKENTNEEEMNSDSYSEIFEEEPLNINLELIPKQAGGENMATAGLEGFRPHDNQDKPDGRREEGSSNTHQSSCVEDGGDQQPSDTGTKNKNKEKDPLEWIPPPFIPWNMKQLRDKKVTVFYPDNIRKREGNIDKKNLLRWLVKRSKLNMLYNEGPGPHPRDLIEKNLEDSGVYGPENYVQFESVPVEKYQLLCEGHWSVVGLDSE